MVNKVLWTVTGSANGLLAHATRIGVGAVCVRTDNAWLAGAIPEFHQHGLKVYGWRWPGIDPQTHLPDYYALDQAHFVANTLVPAGLDGYIADIESDGPHSSNPDWNNKSLSGLADQFSRTIATAGKAAKPGFLFGLTSGFDYPTAFPDIPWSTFLAYADAIFPQIYWRGDGGQAQAGGTPAIAYQRTCESWNSLGPQKMVPIIGEIKYISPDSVRDFGQIMMANQLEEIHYYTDASGLSDAMYDAMHDPCGAAVLPDV